MNDWSSIAVPELGRWQPHKRVSVVIPSYGGQESLDLTLASLTQQTYPAELMEVIVVDDGSLPRLRLPRIRPHDCRLIWVPDVSSNWGIANAVDVGVRASDGEIIQRLDSDMVVFPEHVEAHARWHHAVPFAVTLGSKRFADVKPGQPHWPDAAVLTPPGGVSQLFQGVQTHDHDYIEALLQKTDDLRSGDHLNFRAHVGATVALTREMYERAGGMNVTLRRGSDTEFGYRLAQAGALFVPERQAKSWHLGLSSMMVSASELQRYSRPFLADLMPHPRWLRRTGGMGWAVPLVAVVIEVRDETLEQIRNAVDAVLRSDEPDLHVYLAGQWSKLSSERQPVLQDPRLDLRLVAATYRSDPRVELTEIEPDSVFPTPYLLRLPVRHTLGAASISRMISLLDQKQAGKLTVVCDDGDPAELWRTAALSRAHWTDSAETPSAIRISSSKVGSQPGTHETIEVGGWRSLARAFRLVARLSIGRLLRRR